MLKNPALAILLLATPEFITRQQTTADPQDASALSRCEMWRAGGRGNVGFGDLKYVWELNRHQLRVD